MVAVPHSAGGKYSPPVRTVVREPERTKADEGAREALINQRLMLRVSQDLTLKIMAMDG